MKSQQPEREDTDQRQGGARWDSRRVPWSLWQALEAASHWSGLALLVGSAGPRTQGSCLPPALVPQTQDLVISLPWETPWFSFESPEGPGRGHGSTKAQPGRRQKPLCQSPPTHLHHPCKEHSEEHPDTELWRACFCLSHGIPVSALVTCSPGAPVAQ